MRLLFRYAVSFCSVRCAPCFVFVIPVLSSAKFSMGPMVCCRAVVLSSCRIWHIIGSIPRRNSKGEMTLPCGAPLVWLRGVVYPYCVCIAAVFWRVLLMYCCAGSWSCSHTVFARRCGSLQKAPSSSVLYRWYSCCVRVSVRISSMNVISCVDLFGMNPCMAVGMMFGSCI